MTGGETQDYMYRMQFLGHDQKDRLSLYIGVTEKLVMIGRYDTAGTRPGYRGDSWNKLDSI